LVRLAHRHAERARRALGILDGAQVKAHPAAAIHQVMPSVIASTARNR
jgi:hypothetical protein